MIYALCGISMLLSFAGAWMPFPDGLGASIFSLMVWIVMWVILIGKARYARIRRQYD